MIVYHLISDQYALDVIANQRIKVSRFDDLNDPFELQAMDLNNIKYRNKFLEFKQDMSIRFGLLCFSKNWSNPLLWSHYANRHKGVAFIFEVKDKSVLPMKYRKKRYPIELDSVRNRSWRFSKSETDAIWLTKYHEWKYEEEMRVILNQSEFYQENGIYFHSFGDEILLKGMVLGFLCNISIADIARYLPSGKRLTVIKSRLAFRTFKVVKDETFKTLNLVGKAEQINPADSAKAPSS